MKPLSLSRPHLIVMIGIPGSGKTTFAERFCGTFKSPMISQVALEQIAFGTRYGNVAHEDKAMAIADAILLEMFKLGQTIVYEDASGSRLHRQELAKAANHAGFMPHFVWVQTDSVEASRRALRKAKDTTPITIEQFETVVNRFNVPIASEKPIVISGKHTYASQLKNVLRNLTPERANQPLQVPRRNIKIQ